MIAELFLYCRVENMGMPVASDRTVTLYIFLHMLDSVTTDSTAALLNKLNDILKLFFERWTEKYYL